MSPPTRVRWNFESSFDTSCDVHSGQATMVVPAGETSSSKWCWQATHSYSYSGMRKAYRAGAAADDGPRRPATLRTGLHPPEGYPWHENAQNDP